MSYGYFGNVNFAFLDFCVFKGTGFPKSLLKIAASLEDVVVVYWEPGAGSALKLFLGLPSSGVKVTLRVGNVLP